MQRVIECSVCGSLVIVSVVQISRERYVYSARRRCDRCSSAWADGYRDRVARYGTADERFDSKYIPEPNTGCWIWTGAISGGTGYGSFHAYPVDNQMPSC